MRRLLLAFCVGMLWHASHAQADEIKVMVTEVTDRRTTGQFFAGSEIKLSLVGDALKDVRGVRRIRIIQAVDDTGQSIVKPEEAETSSPFSFELNERQRGPMQKSLKFANPSRGASVIKEVSGTIELYAPARDPKSVATLKNFMGQTGKPLDHPALAKKKIGLTILTKDQLEAMKRAQQERRDKKAGDDLGEKMGEAFAGVFGQIFSGFMRMDENDIAFLIKDPDDNLVDIEVQDEKGIPLKRSGRMRSGDTYTIAFKEKPGPRAQVAIFLATPDSVIRVPLALKDIALP